MDKLWPRAARIGLLLPAVVGTSAYAQTEPASSAASTPQPEAVSTPAAQDQGAGLQDIIVTAQKRSESVQKIPLAVTALSGNDLAKAGINSIEGLQAAVPNLNLGQQLGVARISLRGIGLDNLSTGAEGSIAFHLNSAFISRGAAALSAFYDVDRVEVLRGPQGTLYGRNATGGSINLITRQPTDTFSGYGDVTVGNYGRLAFDGAVSGPIVSDKVLARIAFSTDDRNGYGRNITTGTRIDDTNARSIRGTLKLLPADDLTITLIADYHRENDNANGYHYFGPAGQTASGQTITPFGIQFGGVTASNPRDIANEADPFNRRTIWGVSSEIAYRFGGVTAKSITAYRSTKYITGSDLDSTSFRLAPIFQNEDDKQFSQEFQLSSESDRFRWLLGAFYFHENDAGAIIIPYNDIGFGGPGVIRQGYYAGGRLETDAGAIFGQATYNLTPEIHLVVGGRYSIERKGISEQLQFDLARPYSPANPVAPLAQCGADIPSVPTCQPHKTFRSFTPKVALEYQITPDALLYASVSRGFKSGTYNVGGVQPPVKPEKVTAYEGGLKSEFLDRRLRINLAGFYYDYKDLQVGKVVNASLALENAATATIYGAELELRARPTPDLELGLTGSYLNAKFDSFISIDPARPGGDGRTVDPATGAPAFNNAGNRLPQAPKWTVDAMAQYTVRSDHGSFALRGEVLWVDKVYFSAFNVPQVSQPAKTKLNASLIYTDPGDRWSVTVYGKNLANKTYISNAFVSSSIVGFGVNGFLEEPRTYGVTIGYKF
ncbi:TonB-dependent receptor [Sphingomonas sp. ID1715]|nr:MULTISPECIES: TonB-dependent receptor [Sphingomonadaceae]KTE26434.1 TonB-dependent receptor [Sphingopyxis sp. H057]KTE52839.1 TonB-dependent receptor [Sphingopyxis sp. H073]KTE55027.1 TonB-dependent receptor [Sphingopyxis sp. H071]KTE62489.1 TonB-dependent receptor [Sphingopyxis sp. H107]KTE66034.1 TonB-dependent receptor [Sphingopyxis sp. H100]KTE73586.1 TonB-dependent receptor [Sphingopyxis sp. H081]KTE80922.1 TonB-dependent receptor [Sphingopyxis sp. H067]MBA4080288.1 TonB-dependent r